MLEYLNEYKELIPIISFLLGYILNSIIGILTTKHEANSVKKVLLYEVNRNVYLLNVALEHDFTSQTVGEEIINKAKVIARLAEDMSNHLFNTHSLHFPKMNKTDVEQFLDFYSTLDSLKRYCKEFILLINIRDRNKKTK